MSLAPLLIFPLPYFQAPALPPGFGLIPKPVTLSALFPGYGPAPVGPLTSLTSPNPKQLVFSRQVHNILDCPALGLKCIPGVSQELLCSPPAQELFILWPPGSDCLSQLRPWAYILSKPSPLLVRCFPLSAT